ncbi:unnamed protein product [Sympodiomycopsis kandeliae]
MIHKTLKMRFTKIAISVCSLFFAASGAQAKLRGYWYPVLDCPSDKAGALDFDGSQMNLPGGAKAVFMFESATIYEDVGASGNSKGAPARVCTYFGSIRGQDTLIKSVKI